MSQEVGALAQYFRRHPLCATEPRQRYCRYGGPKRSANVVLFSLVLLRTNAVVRGCGYKFKSADCASSNSAQPGEQFADSFPGSREGPGKHVAQAVDFEEAASHQPSPVAISSYKLTAARCGSRQAGLCSATAFGVDEALLPMALSRDIGLETNAR